MRAIKFRMLVTSGDKPWHHWTFPGSIEYCETSMKHYNLDSWTQFTGLVDKHGVEIYEGDVVKATVSGYFFNAKQTKVSQVVWGIWDDEEYGSCETWVLPDLKNYPVYSSECEVVGNIFENKDLLE